jgi:hypothetical protein
MNELQIHYETYQIGDRTPNIKEVVESNKQDIG